MLTQILASQERIVERVGHIEKTIADALARLETSANINSAATQDHELRIRVNERLIGNFLPREAVEKLVDDARLETEMKVASAKAEAGEAGNRRERRLYAFGALAVATVVPIITTVVTLLLSHAGA